MAGRLLHVQGRIVFVDVFTADCLMLQWAEQGHQSIEFNDL